MYWTCPICGCMNYEACENREICQGCGWIRGFAYSLWVL